jgi:hypothetical protein
VAKACDMGLVSVPSISGMWDPGRIVKLPASHKADPRPFRIAIRAL